MWTWIKGLKFLLYTTRTPSFTKLSGEQSTCFIQFNLKTKQNVMNQLLKSLLLRFRKKFRKSKICHYLLCVTILRRRLLLTPLMGFRLNIMSVINILLTIDNLYSPTPEG